jgi:hypothetical protein
MANITDEILARLLAILKDADGIEDATIIEGTWGIARHLVAVAGQRNVRVE